MNAPSSYKIEAAVSAWQSARARLLHEDPDLEADEAALGRLLGPEDGDVDAILERLIRAVRHAEVMAAGAGEQAKLISGRAARYKARADSMRGTAFAIMLAIDRLRFELPDMTVTIADGQQSVEVTDLDALPPEFVKVEETAKKAEIAKALKSGTAVPGARLVDGMPQFRIHTK